MKSNILVLNFLSRLYDGCFVYPFRSPILNEPGHRQAFFYVANNQIPGNKFLAIYSELNHNKVLLFNENENITAKAPLYQKKASSKTFPAYYFALYKIKLIQINFLLNMTCSPLSAWSSQLEMSPECEWQPTFYGCIQQLLIKLLLTGEVSWLRPISTKKSTLVSRMTVNTIIWYS